MMISFNHIRQRCDAAIAIDRPKNVACKQRKTHKMFATSTDQYDKIVQRRKLENPFTKQTQNARDYPLSGIGILAKCSFSTHKQYQWQLKRAIRELSTQKRLCSGRKWPRVFHQQAHIYNNNNVESPPFTVSVT